ncbi:MAG TPA: SDR family NAD(P)-dependent oxidoreductase [Sandaracinaceae bacterium LLY-WYZ-13_1]|nr:SDR family NAD(P)-dependent oxidoreductase [Sandaracinaceae bacterium LLY-WYZ-13_1]
MSRVALVTGATGRIGEAIARGLAERGLEVVLAARDEAKLARTAARIDGAARTEVVELSSRASIEALRERWTGPLHVLMNVAAQCPRGRRESDEGVELQWATNVLGYFRMVRAFEEALAESAPSRVILVASYWAGGLDLDDPEMTRRPYDNDAAYRQSKQADRMLAAAFAERLRDRGVTVNACHPGDVRSNLSQDLGFGGHETPEQGADTPVWLATDPVGAERSGRYFRSRREEADRFTADRDAVEALYSLCASYGGGAR